MIKRYRGTSSQTHPQLHGSFLSPHTHRCPGWARCHLTVTVRISNLTNNGAYTQGYQSWIEPARWGLGKSPKANAQPPNLCMHEWNIRLTQRSQNLQKYLTCSIEGKNSVYLQKIIFFTIREHSLILTFKKKWAIQTGRNATP